MKKLVSALVAICLVFALLPWSTIVVSAENIVSYTDGKINFTRDFSTENAYDMSWKEDKAVYETDGDLVITPNSIRALGCGKQNVRSSGSGYVSWLIQAPDGCTIETLQYNATGRAYHSSSNTECSSGACSCGYEVSVSVDDGATYTKVSTEEIVTSGSTRDFAYNLTSVVAGSESAIVKLYMSGKNWDWVHMKNVAITGTYVEKEEYVPTSDGEFIFGDGTFTLVRDFTDCSAYDMSFVNDKSVYESYGYITVQDPVRGLGSGRQNKSSSGSGYISYLLNVPDGNVVDTLLFTAHGRAYHSSSNAECKAGTCSCDFQIYISKDGGATYKNATNYDISSGNSNWGQEYAFDLTEVAKGAKQLIVKIAISGKSWNWISFTDYKISGTYVASSPEHHYEDEYDYRFKADYSKLEAYDTSWQDNAYAYSFMERGPENPTLGVGKRNVSSDGTGYVIYKFDAPDGKLLADMQIYINGRAFHYNGDKECGSGECNCGLNIYVSQDGENYTLAATEEPGLSGAFGVGFYHNISRYVRNAKTAYLKIEITTKNWDWISMSSLEVYGNYKDVIVGISGEVSVSSEKDTFTVGDNLAITVDVENTNNSDFAGHIELVYPSYYLDVETAKQDIFIASSKSENYVFDVKALEGGYGNAFVCIYDDNGNLLDHVELIIFVSGKGVYLGDPHNHSFESDGRSSFLDNFTQLAEKGFSFVITADHNAVDPWNKATQDAAVAELKKTFDGEFVALKGSEITTAGNAHVLCYNHTTNYAALKDSQWIIDEVINQGGLAFLAHPFIGENYYFNGIEDDQTATDIYKNFTGVEIYNGETSMVRSQDGEYNFKNLEFWDRMNLTGQRKFFGTAGSDAHDSIIIGTVGNALLADSLSEEDLMKAFATGKFYVTNGPSIRMSIGNATFGQTYEVNTAYDNLADLCISVYDPDYPITKVVLYKYTIGDDIDAAYEKGQEEALVLYERAGDTIYSFDYSGKISVKAGEFYRLAVYTVKGSHNWPCENDYGLAYGNPIWIGKQISNVNLTANPTKLTYEMGDALDLEGMTLTVTYYDGSTAEVMGWYAYGFDSSQIGTSTVNILYEGYINSFDVTINEKQGVVKAEDGKISFFRDFTIFDAFDESWKNDPAVEGVSGDICIQSPDKGLGSGKQNVSSTGAGYIDYKVSVPEGNVITSLVLTAIGRAYHSTSNSECSAGNCSCEFTVGISTNNGITFEEVYNHDFSTATSTFGQRFIISMDDAVQNYDSVIVRISLSGKSWNWVSFTEFSMSGTYEEGEALPQPAKGSIWYENGQIIWDKNFTILPEYDMTWAEDNSVYETGGALTVSPSTNRTLGVGQRNTNSSGSGWVSYIVDVPEGNILDTLTFIARGRAYHSSSSEDCKNGNCTCAFKVYISVDGGKIYKEVYDHKFNHNDSSFNNEFMFDFTDYIQNKKTAIIKVYMSGRSWNWVGFTDFSIRGTYEEGIYIPDVIVENSISVQYDQIGVGDDDQWQENAYAYENLVIGSGEKPWLSVYPVNGSWEGVVGSVVYKIVSDVGRFDEFTVSGTARVFTFENSPAAFRLYYSTNGETYHLFKDYPPITNGEELLYFNESLIDCIGNTDVVYVKIEMVSGYWDWVCLKNLNINGVSKTTHINVCVKDGDSVIYENNMFLANTSLDTSFTKEGYAFDGLFYNAELTEAYNGERITGDTVLYVKWIFKCHNITVKKMWNDADNQDGIRPESITINLLANGIKIATKTVTAGDGWAWTFSDLAKYEDGKEIVYTITEDAVAGGYTSQISGDAQHGYVITNTVEDVPDTGDMATLGLWLMSFAVSGTALTSSLLYNRKKRKVK